MCSPSFPLQDIHGCTIWAICTTVKWKIILTLIKNVHISTSHGLFTIYLYTSVFLWLCICIIWKSSRVEKISLLVDIAISKLNHKLDRFDLNFFLVGSIQVRKISICYNSNTNHGIYYRNHPVQFLMTHNISENKITYEKPIHPSITSFVRHATEFLCTQCNWSKSWD